MRTVDADALCESLKRGLNDDGNCYDSYWMKEARDAKYEFAIDAIQDAPTIENNKDTSDGYHTFGELYHHRAVLFSIICNDRPSLAWKSLKHSDGTMFDDCFVVGIQTPTGMASYHYHVDPYWDMFKVPELEFAPEWDGYTPAQSIERIGGLPKLETVIHARWARESVLYNYGCTNCDCRSWDRFAYCPRCGAFMDATTPANA